MQQSDIPQPVSTDELQQAVEILAKFEPGYLPFPLFMAIARLVVFAIIEVVPVRRAADGTVEVLLTQRPDDDPLWPSMWHNPGVVVLASDTPGSYKDPYQRVARELGAPTGFPDPIFVGLSFHKTRRGTDAAMIHYLELPKDFEPVHGKFFAADALPGDIIESNEPLIRSAIAAYIGS
ncbi:MAG: hypothetical protein ACQR33_05160 [Candidatus Saccharibacteria bacterium]